MAEAFVAGGGSQKYVCLNLTVDEAAWIRLLVGRVGGMDTVGLRDTNDAIYRALSKVVTPMPQYPHSTTRFALIRRIFSEDGTIAVDSGFTGEGWEPQLLAEGDDDG